MGYYTNFDGEIAITPPLLWSEIKDSPFVQPGPYGTVDRDCMLRVVEETVETEEGTLIRKQAVAVLCTYEDQAKAYSIVEHLQELINLHGKGRSFSGYISAEGEEAGDLWRLTVKNGQAVKVEPRIVWPEEA